MANTPTLRANGLQGRKIEFLERFFELAEPGRDGRAIHDAIFDALTTATVQTRVPDANVPRGYAYALLPDHPVRLTAARLLAEIWGMVGSRDSIGVNVNAETVSITIDQRVAELEAVGIPREQLVAELRQVVEQAERAGPGKPAKPV